MLTLSLLSTSLIYGTFPTAVDKSRQPGSSRELVLFSQSYFAAMLSLAGCSQQGVVPFWQVSGLCNQEKWDACSMASACTACDGNYS